MKTYTFWVSSAIDIEAETEEQAEEIFEKTPKTDIWEAMVVTDFFCDEDVEDFTDKISN